MEFGLLKSKIETKLVESYKNNTFSKEIKQFKKLVLEDKDVRKMFYIYDELSKEKGFDPNFAEEYLEECVGIIDRTEISPRTKIKLNLWVKDVVCENFYEEIDTVAFKNTFIIENIINSKNNIISSLSTKKTDTEVVKIPLEKMVEVANNTLKDYLSNISESELKEIKKYSELSETELNQRYNFLSEMVIEKLDKMSDESDSETKSKITETIDRIKNEKIDLISFIKLKNLNGEI
jgi:hypothetical protein